MCPGRSRSSEGEGGHQLVQARGGRHLGGDLREPARGQRHEPQPAATARPVDQLRRRRAVGVLLAAAAVPQRALGRLGQGDAADAGELQHRLGRRAPTAAVQRVVSASAPPVPSTATRSP